MKQHLERITAINPTRIQWCCQEQGITPSELAEIIGIAHSTFTRMMAGEVGITFNQLRKIAHYCNRGVLFFLEQEPVDTTRIYSPQFRIIANQKLHISTKVKAIIERVERQRDIYLNLREELAVEEEGKFEPPELPRNNPRLAATISREWLGLNDINNFNSYRDVVESKGILVFRSNGYNGQWQIPKDDPVIGFSIYHQACPVIVIKKQVALARQSFTLMHELGHVLLHLSSIIDDEDDLYNNQAGSDEQQANTFAGHILVPDEFLDQIIDTDRPEDVAAYDTWLEDKRGAWGVSGEVILRRLLDVGRLDQAKYIEYRSLHANQPIHIDDGGSREWRHREPIHVFGDTFVRTILDATRANYITLNKASSYLDNLKIKDLHRLDTWYANI